MGLFRESRITSVLKHELNNLLLRDFEFGNTFVTITSIEVSSNMLQAKVKIAIIPEENGLKVLRALESKKKELQYKLLKRTRLRSIPRLVFEIENH